MTGEMQRIIMAPVRPCSRQAEQVRCISTDGWAIGGQATTFSTGVLSIKPRRYDAQHVTPYGKQMNNGYFCSPGSEHSGGANFGLADGSVRFINETIDANVFALLGSMADDVPIVRFDRSAGSRTADTTSSRRQFYCRLFFVRVGFFAAPPLRRGRADPSPVSPGSIILCKPAIDSGCRQLVSFQ